MNKIKCFLPLAVLSLTSLVGCNNKPTVYIYTAHEENRIQLYNKELKEHFPNYNIRVVSKDTGSLLNGLQTEGTKGKCDIFVGIEITNAEILLKNNPDLFADDMASIERVQKQLVDKLRSLLGIGAKVTLVNPNSITRSEGKAKRVIDKRKLVWGE